MSKHTPGPWESMPHGNITSIVTTSRILLASIMTDSAPHPYIDKEESAANARLITTAPDLLEVCMSLVEITPGDHITCGEAEELMRKLDRMCEKARQAITRATEEKS